MPRKKTVKKLKRRKSYGHSPLKNPWVKLFCVIFIIIVLLLLRIYKQAHRPVIIGEWQKMATSQQPTPTVAPALPYPSEFKKKNYNPDDEAFPYTKIHYKDLIPTDDGILKEISCSTGYDARDLEVSYVGSVRRYVNPEIKKAVNIITNDNPKVIVGIKLCTDKTKTIAFHYKGCGGGCYKPSISILENNKLLKTVEPENIVKMPYYTCSDLLEITNSGDMYIRCGGGDGPGAGYSLMKMNLSDYSLTTIKSCSFDSSSGKTINTCSN